MMRADPIDALIDEAQQFDGYGHVGGSTEAAQRLADQVRCAWVVGDAHNFPVADLRTALFAECRTLHLSDDFLNDDLRRYLFALQQLIDDPTSDPNPWCGLRSSKGSRLVLSEDEPAIDAFYDTLGADAAGAVDLSLWPEPWMGRLDAPIVLLNLNPGIGPDTPAAHSDDLVARAAQENLHQTRTSWPLFCLDPAFGDTPGARWWHGCLKVWIEEFGAAFIANHVVGYEFFGYHSRSYRTVPVSLASQQWVFRQVRRRIDEGALIIASRGANSWKVAVPELCSYGGFHTTRNPQSRSVNPGNFNAEAAGALRTQLNDARPR